MSAGEQWDAERARLHELMAVSEAERAVADVRMADLAAAQTTAWRHHRGERRGDPGTQGRGADKIAAAQERERRAYAEPQYVADGGIDEMFVTRARLERFGELVEGLGTAWAADSAQPGEMPGREVEAGQ